MECWWEEPSSHDRIVHVNSCVRSVSGAQVMAASLDFVDFQNQIDWIIKNKDIHQKV